MHANVVDGMANSVDPDEGAVWSGSTLFAQTCSGILWCVFHKSDMAGPFMDDAVINKGFTLHTFNWL